MIIVYFIILLLCEIFILPSSDAALSLQTLIHQKSENDIVILKPGVYKGPLIINKSITIDGNSVAAIEGMGMGSVIIINANGVTLKNLKISNSGNSHDQVDSGISIRSSNNRIYNNTIDNVLFGIELRQAHDNEIIGNDISSKPVDLGQRGDGIKVWASHRNVFRDNKIYDTRDMVIWYSNDNIVENNEGWNNRYSLHFMYNDRTLVRGNKYYNNSVGIFLMYSKNSVLEYNDIQNSIGPTGIGIGMKEADNMTVQFNTIVYCATGIYLDQSPFDPFTYNYFFGNKIVYNVKGIELHSTLKHNVFKGNMLSNNLDTVVVHSNGTAKHNIWEGNYWGDYKGFDRNKDEYGDSAFISYAYLDQIWMHDPWVRFYYASPVMSLVNFLAKLIPLTEPKLLLTDENPVFFQDSRVRLSKDNLFFETPDFDEDEDLYN